MKFIKSLALILAAALVTPLLAVVADKLVLAQQATTVPTLTPAPTPTPRPSPTPRVFTCSCGNYGNAAAGIPPVSWQGRVQAPDYFFARQSATQQCLGYLGARPTSVIIPTPGFSLGARALQPATPIFNPCAICACN